MRVAVTGSTGLIGSALVQRLEADGHQAVRVVRPVRAARPAVAPPSADAPTEEWDPAAGPTLVA